MYYVIRAVKFNGTEAFEYVYLYRESTNLN